MKHKSRCTKQRKHPKTRLRLPDLEFSKTPRGVPEKRSRLRPRDVLAYISPRRANLSARSIRGRHSLQPFGSALPSYSCPLLPRSQRGGGMARQGIRFYCTVTYRQSQNSNARR
jgi:hypothetical protein